LLFTYEFQVFCTNFKYMKSWLVSHIVCIFRSATLLEDQIELKNISFTIHQIKTFFSIYGGANEIHILFHNVELYNFSWEAIYLGHDHVFRS
jgi:hypothetical protein